MIMSSLKAGKLIIKAKKNGIGKTRLRPRIIESLPPEMITEVVTRVAATSAIDLFRCKQTCKILREIAEEKRVLQQAAIEVLYPSIWRNQEKAESFFERCRDNNNPEALYRLGMIQYFSQWRAVEGLKNLEKAAAQRYKEAIYALGLIRTCSGDKECTNKGVELLMDLMKAIKGEGIIELRTKLHELMPTLRWLRVHLDTGNMIVMVLPKINCTKGELHEIESCWEKGDYYDDKVEDNVVCGDCKCCREVAFFRNLVLGDN